MNLERGKLGTHLLALLRQGLLKVLAGSIEAFAQSGDLTGQVGITLFPPFLQGIDLFALLLQSGLKVLAGLMQLCLQITDGFGQSLLSQAPHHTVQLRTGLQDFIV